MRAKIFDGKVRRSPADIAAATDYLRVDILFHLMKLAVGAAAHRKMYIKALPRIADRPYGIARLMEKASHLMAISHILEWRFLLGADRHAMRAAGMKTATRGQINRAGNVTFDSGK